MVLSAVITLVVHALDFVTFMTVLSAVLVLERMSEHVRKARFVDKVVYRMAPLLSASELLETDPLDAIKAI